MTIYLHKPAVFLTLRDFKGREIPNKKLAKRIEEEVSSELRKEVWFYANTDLTIAGSRWHCKSVQYLIEMTSDAEGNLDKKIALRITLYPASLRLHKGIG